MAGERVAHLQLAHLHTLHHKLRIAQVTDQHLAARLPAQQQVVALVQLLEHIQVIAQHIVARVVLALAEAGKVAVAHVGRQSVERRDAWLHITAHIVPQAHQRARADCLTRRLLDATRQQCKVLGRGQRVTQLVMRRAFQGHDGTLFVRIHLLYC